MLLCLEPPLLRRQKILCLGTVSWSPGRPHGLCVRLLFRLDLADSCPAESNRVVVPPLCAPPLTHLTLDRRLRFLVYFSGWNRRIPERVQSHRPAEPVEVKFCYRQSTAAGCRCLSDGA